MPDKIVIEIFAHYMALPSHAIPEHIILVEMDKNLTNMGMQWREQGYVEVTSNAATMTCNTYWRILCQNDACQWMWKSNICLVTLYQKIYLVNIKGHTQGKTQ